MIPLGILASVGGLAWSAKSTLPSVIHTASAYAPLTDGSWFVFRDNSATNYSRSTDGVTWVTRSLPTGDNWQIAVASPSRVLIFDDSTGTNWRTTDGTTWTAGSENLDIECAIFDGTRFLAGNSFGRIESSTNGLSWSDAIVFTGGTTPVTGIGFSGSRYIAVGNTSQNFIRTNTGDPTVSASWSNVTMPLTRSRRDVVFGNGVWIITSNNSTTYEYSTNGTTWTTGTLPRAVSGERRASGIGFMLGRFAYIASNGTNWAVVESENGINWSQTVIETTTRGFRPYGFATDGTKAIITGTEISGTTPIASTRYGYGE
jgi:hypothetical protein